MMETSARSIVAGVRNFNPAHGRVEARNSERGSALFLIVLASIENSHWKFQATFRRTFPLLPPKTFVPCCFEINGSLPPYSITLRCKWIRSCLGLQTAHARRFSFFLLFSFFFFFNMLLLCGYLVVVFIYGGFHIRVMGLCGVISVRVWSRLGIFDSFSFGGWLRSKLSLNVEIVEGLQVWWLICARSKSVHYRKILKM